METFVTKDNGDRAVFDGGMVRDTEIGKTRWDLIPDYVLFEAIRTEKNAKAIDAYVAYKDTCRYGKSCVQFIQSVIDLECGGDAIAFWKRVSDLMARGAIKYVELNWMKGTTVDVQDRYKKSLDRHFKQWLLGDREEDHAAAIAFNINGIIYTELFK